MFEEIVEDDVGELVDDVERLYKKLWISVKTVKKLLKMTLANLLTLQKTLNVNVFGVTQEELCSYAMIVVTATTHLKNG